MSGCHTVTRRSGGGSGGSNSGHSASPPNWRGKWSAATLLNISRDSSAWIVIWRATCAGTTLVKRPPKDRGDRRLAVHDVQLAHNKRVVVQEHLHGLDHGGNQSRHHHAAKGASFHVRDRAEPRDLAPALIQERGSSTGWPNRFLSSNFFFTEARMTASLALDMRSICSRCTRRPSARRLPIPRY